jgi:hypothetical protein
VLFFKYEILLLLVSSNLNLIPVSLNKLFLQYEVGKKEKQTFLQNLNRVFGGKANIGGFII